MHVGELLHRIAEHSVTLRCGRTEDRLHYAPVGALPPELAAELKDHKMEILRILRDDEEYRRTGIIQKEQRAPGLRSGPQLLRERWQSLNGSGYAEKRRIAVSKRAGFPEAVQGRGEGDR